MEGQSSRNSEDAFQSFKRSVREEIDKPLLERDVSNWNRTQRRGVWWEEHDDRIRRPEQVLKSTENPLFMVEQVPHNIRKTNWTYPILVGTPYQIPLENLRSNIIVTGHGDTSISGLNKFID